MHRSFLHALAVRAVYAGAIVTAVLAHGIGIAVTHGPIFLGSLFLLFLGARDARWYRVDMLACATFTGAIAVMMSPLWITEGGPFGADKLLHALGGAVAAMATATLYAHHVRGAWWRAAAIVSGALAIGAAWEVFEWILSVLPAPYTVHHSGMGDSMMDLIADTLGAIVVAAWTIRVSSRVRAASATDADGSGSSRGGRARTR